MKPISAILAEFVADLEPRAVSTVQAEDELRHRLASKVRNGRLWSIGTTEEQLALNVDRAS